MPNLTVRHITTYRYAEPVMFGDHRMMLRPRDSHDLRLVRTKVRITPQPTSLRWLHDVFGNSVAIASFDARADELQIESEIELEHFEQSEPDCPIEPYATTFPFAYSADDMPDLVRSIERLYPDPERKIDLWAKNFLTEGTIETLPLLSRMTHAIHEGFVYAARDAEGVQTPVETLALQSGTCRDFATLMMEAARALGLAARFVSGYIYVPSANEEGQILGGCATHAWVQVHLPGAGWMEFDPTNGIIGNRDLIRVAVVRSPAQAIPISGAWTGPPNVFLGMTIDVKVTISGAEPAVILMNTAA